MKTDALNRRLRFAPPNPQVSRLVLTDLDYLVFEAINRHGPLPTHYLFEFVRTGAGTTPDFRTGSPSSTTATAPAHT